MKTKFKRTAAVLSCSVLALSQVPDAAVFAAENPKGNITVTVYDDETGELMSGSIGFMITGATEALEKMGQSFSFGTWNISETNPYTDDAFEIRSGWNYQVRLSGYTDPYYHYSLNADKSQTVLAFDSSEEQNLSLYVQKQEKYGMLIYRGTFGEEKYPLFDYFYPPNYSNQFSEHTPVIYDGEFPEQLKYGDVFTMSKQSPLLPSGYKTVRTLSPDAELKRSGSCLDPDDERFAVETLTFSAIYRKQSKENQEPDPQQGVSFVLEDESGMEYEYASYEYLLDSECLVDSAKLGDTTDFVVAGRYPVLPLNAPKHEPDIMGDINEDREFTLADVVLLNRWLLADPDVLIPDWIAADFNKDGKLDAADLLLMKQALWDDRARPSCTLNILTSYDGYSVDGRPLEEGSFTQTFTVRAGDWFCEDSQAGWVKNTLDQKRHDGKLLTVMSITEDGVVINYNAADRRPADPENGDYLIPFDESREVLSNIRIMDGYSFTHFITFSDFNAGSRYVPPEV